MDIIAFHLDAVMSANWVTLVVLQILYIESNLKDNSNVV